MRVKLISICICLFVCTFLILCTGCQSNKDTPKEVKQSATAWIQEDDVRTSATVDLTGGWSVEFAPGAVYLYDKEITPGTDAVAMCITLSEEVYNDHLKEAKESKTYKEMDDYIYYEGYDSYEYLYNLNNTYFLISVYDKLQSNDIIKRFSLIPEQ